MQSNLSKRNLSDFKYGKPVARGVTILSLGDVISDNTPTEREENFLVDVTSTLRKIILLRDYD